MLFPHRAWPSTDRRRAGFVRCQRAELGSMRMAGWRCWPWLWSGRRPPAPTTARLDWPLRPRPAVMRMFDAPSPNWNRGHRGVDLAGTPGQPVYAARGGHGGVRRRAGGPAVGVDRPSRRAADQLRAGAADGAGRAAGERGAVLGELEAGHPGCAARRACTGERCGVRRRAPTTSTRWGCWPAPRSASSHCTRVTATERA